MDFLLLENERDDGAIMVPIGAIFSEDGIKDFPGVCHHQGFP
jgi:hypothetical protein